MSDKTKKELCEIIMDLEKKIADHEKHISELRERLHESQDSTGKEYGRVMEAREELKELKEKARDSFIDRARVIGNLVNMIQGMVTFAKDVDRLPQTGQMPKFLSE